MPTLNITLSLPQDEIDSIREAAKDESLASLTARALRRELRERNAAAYAAWNDSLPDEVKADLQAWDAAPMPGWDA
jgi:predicted HTH domain antitoxin